MTKRVRRYLQLGTVAIIVVTMGHFLRTHGGEMVRSASLFMSWNLAAAFGLCIVHRIMNAAGWGIVLGSLGESVHVAPAARLWLASEACRWIPGSVWGFGSRAALASDRGIPLRSAASSVVYEVVATVVGWLIVGILVVPSPELMRTLIPGDLLASGNTVIYTVSLFGILILGSIAIVRTNRVLAPRVAADGHAGPWMIPDARRFACAVLFYTLMAAFNGMILVVILRTLADGRAIPVASVLAINAIAWLTGFFALFAPGGLVIREACIVGLLSTWIPAEQALAIALAWRFVQITAEMVTFAGVVATGLPDGALREHSPPPDPTYMTENDRSVADTGVVHGREAMLFGVA